jgi:membrane-bound inhibitor of C-type lysozyme
MKKYLVIGGIMWLAACNSTGSDRSVGSAASADVFSGIPTIHYNCQNDPAGELAVTPGRGAPAVARVEYGGTEWVLSGQPTGTGARYTNGQVTLVTTPGEATIQQDGRTSKCRQAS